MNEESVRREPRMMSETSNGEGEASREATTERRSDDRVREKERKWQGEK